LDPHYRKNILVHSFPDIFCVKKRNIHLLLPSFVRKDPEVSLLPDKQQSGSPSLHLQIPTLFFQVFHVIFNLSRPVSPYADLISCSGNLQSAEVIPSFQIQNIFPVGCSESSPAKHSFYVNGLHDNPRRDPV